MKPRQEEKPQLARVLEGCMRVPHIPVHNLHPSLPLCSGAMIKRLNHEVAFTSSLNKSKKVFVGIRSSQFSS
jgi:hypothetical protein